MIDLNYFEHKNGYKILYTEDVDSLQDHELYVGINVVTPDGIVHKWDGEKWVDNVP